MKRLVARVKALMPRHWIGAAGDRFRDAIDITSKAANEVLPDKDRSAALLAEGIKRVAVGKTSVEYSTALKNFADEENSKINTELAKDVFDARVRQEKAKADQEETRASIMRTELMMARLVLFEKLQIVNCVPVWDRDGNMQILKTSSPVVIERARQLLVSDEDIETLEVLTGSNDRDDGST